MNTQTQSLRDAEIAYCKLRAEAAALETRISQLDGNDSALRNQFREDLRTLNNRMKVVQIEQMQHRVALLSEQLPHDRDAIVPLQQAFDDADLHYRQSYDTREKAAVALEQAKLKVGNAECNIGFYQRSIEKLQTELATSQGNGAKLASEIASELTGLESKLRELRTIAAQ